MTLFKYRLAAHLGMIVSELEIRMTHQELMHWFAYYRLEPFGSGIDNLRAGIITSTIANIHRDKKTKPFKPSDFMPTIKRKLSKGAITQKVLKIFRSL